MKRTICKTGSGKRMRQQRLCAKPRTNCLHEEVMKDHNGTVAKVISTTKTRIKCHKIRLNWRHPLSGMGGYAKCRIRKGIGAERSSHGCSWDWYRTRGTSYLLRWITNPIDRTPQMIQKEHIKQRNHATDEKCRGVTHLAHSKLQETKKPGTNMDQHSNRTITETKRHCDHSGKIEIIASQNKGNETIQQVAPESQVIAPNESRTMNGMQNLAVQPKIASNEETGIYNTPHVQPQIGRSKQPDSQTIDGTNQITNTTRTELMQRMELLGDNASSNYGTDNSKNPSQISEQSIGQDTSACRSERDNVINVRLHSHNGTQMDSVRTQHPRQPRTHVKKSIGICRQTRSAVCTTNSISRLHMHRIETDLIRTQNKHIDIPQSKEGIGAGYRTPPSFDRPRKKGKQLIVTTAATPPLQ